MLWRVEFYSDFALEVQKLPRVVRVEMASLVNLLETLGPTMSRPRSDTLNGSKHANMKELRFTADGGVWRVAYAFDPERKAVLLVAGDKSGVGQKQFYRSLIRRADARFDEYLKNLSQKVRK